MLQSGTLVPKFQVNSTLKVKAVLYSERLQVMSQNQFCILEACRLYHAQNINNDREKVLFLTKFHKKKEVLHININRRKRNSTNTNTDTDDDDDDDVVLWR